MGYIFALLCSCIIVTIGCCCPVSGIVLLLLIDIAIGTCLPPLQDMLNAGRAERAKNGGPKGKKDGGKDGKKGPGAAAAGPRRGAR